MQGQAEHYLEKLHGVVEQDLRAMLEEGKVEPHKWAKFRESLIGLTDVTRSHFEKLVQVGHAVAGFNACIAERRR